MSAAKTKKKVKSKARKPATKKIAAHGKKAVKKTAKPRAKATPKRKSTMATKKDEETSRDKRKAGEIDTGTEHPPLKPDGTEYEEGIDPMAAPPDGPLSPSEASRVDQGGEVDLSGSPGSAGEYVPVIEPSREHEPGTTAENRPPREDSDPRETARESATKTGSSPYQNQEQNRAAPPKDHKK